MGSSLNEKLNRLPERRRERVLADAGRLHAELLNSRRPAKAERPVAGVAGEGFQSAAEGDGTGRDGPGP